MFPRETFDLARLLSDTGVIDREAAAICGVSLRTIRHWRHGTRRASPGHLDGRSRPTCPRCHGRPLDEPAYAYLLGLYLGDGHIVAAPRSFLLTVACADAWPGLIGEAERATRAVMPSSRVRRRTRPGVACTWVSSTARHWPCLFPQHGPGRKHLRKIELQPWQEEIVAVYAGAFARGLFHSDGCRLINRVRRGERHYEYPRYFFVNHSADILRLCGQVLDQLGVDWRRSKPTTISVARRAAVARLDEHVGPKY